MLRMYCDVAYAAARETAAADVYFVIVCADSGYGCAALGYYVILILRTIVFTIAFG